jgi:serine protease AprX
MFLRRMPTKFLTAVILLIAMFAGLSAGFVYNPTANAQDQIEQSLSQKPNESAELSIADKLSDDLEMQMAGAAFGDASDIAKVIVQTKSVPKAGLSTAIMNAGGLIKKTYQNFNAIAMEIPNAGLRALAARSDVNYISLDRPAQVTGHIETTTGTSLVRNSGPAGSQLDGTGIGIAILDSGIYSSHVSFQNSGTASRVIARINFAGDNPCQTGGCDPDGHGTHVAGLAAANGKVAGGAYKGIASNANLIDVRVLNAQGVGSSSGILAGIDWCISNKTAYNIRVINLSLGTTAVDSYKNDILCLAVRRAVNAGIVVCVAAGNLGKNEYGNKVYGAIHSPGIEPSAITVGAADTKGSNARDNDGVASYSSRGPTRGYQMVNGVKKYDNLIKPDLVAPGNKVVSVMAPNNRRLLNSPGLDALVSLVTNRKQMRMSGTSMATPVVAGAAALLLQKNPALTPNLVKAILMYSSQQLRNFTTLEQGAGLLNVEGAVRIAGLVRTDLANLQLNAPLLTGTAPTQTSTIANQTFTWSGGLILNWNHISGSSLITKYHGIYKLGVVLGDAVTLGGGVFIPNGVVLGDGVLIGNGVVLGDGTVLGAGTSIISSLLLADGIVLGDGVVLGDGLVLSDSLLESTPAWANSLLVPGVGDDTEGMLVIIDLELL